MPPTTVQDDFDYSGMETHLYLCSKMVRRYSNLKDEHEGLSIAMGALMHAYRVYIIDNLEGSFTSYANKAMARALAEAVEKQKRGLQYASLEAMMEKGGSQPVVSAESLEGPIDVVETFVEFLASLGPTDREIIKFRITHPYLSLAETASILSSRLVSVPASQGGLTKRLQKLSRKWQRFRGDIE